LFPDRKEWSHWLKRPYVDNRAVLESVQSILNAVKLHGDEALRSFTKKFEGADPEQFEVSHNEIQNAIQQVPEELRNAILHAKQNIEAFHKMQLSATMTVETVEGIRCWRREVAIETVGLYIPGGTAPLFSTVLMLAVPAKLAGCREIILCTPSGKDGIVHPAILFAASITGVTRVFRAGGAQAIAALAFGTESIPAVDKIFGPGNQYVTAAKQLVQMQGVAIDMPAGPSEVCVLADATADPSFVAADLLSQAEHGSDSQVLLVSNDETVVSKVKAAIDVQLEGLPRKELAQKALANSRAIVVKNQDEAIDLVNAYAPEHLILSCRDADAMADRITNAGSVFIGHFSPESVGDYATGTNHTLPTNGFARAYSGVSVDSFVKKITFQKLSREGLGRIAQTVVVMAEAEGLQAHANAVRIRIDQKESI
ncbi:MAG TPA: histidinol dehydrogenase, partial [Flavisolibacter sp.]|nr:histidinol dehydrogenase [Flavisolibacter sp.]